MEIKNFGTPRKSKMKNKICNNCGAVMHWNPTREMWICNMCGNSLRFKDYMSERRTLFDD